MVAGHRPTVTGGERAQQDLSPEAAPPTSENCTEVTAWPGLTPEGTVLRAGC